MEKTKDPSEFMKFWEGADRNTHCAKQGLRVYLNQLEAFYIKCGRGDGKFTSSGITVGECKLFATLKCLTMVDANVLMGCPCLSTFMGRFGALSQVRAVVEGR